MVSPFTPLRRAVKAQAGGRYSGSAAVLNEEAAQAAFSSPPHRRAFSPEVYRAADRPFGRRRTSPVMVQDCASPGGGMCHLRCWPPVTVCPAAWGIRFPRRFNWGRCLAHAAGRSAVSRSLSSWPRRDGAFFRTSRRRRPGCIPALKVTRFETRVLYRHGPAQVGIGVFEWTLLSSPHRLFKGRLSPEPLRLTRPFRVGTEPTTFNLGLRPGL
jgi:hypothetical protein